MRKTLALIFILSWSAIFFMGCGSSGTSNVVTPPQSQTSKFAFLEEVAGQTNVFAPMIGKFVTTNGNTTFSAKAAVDSEGAPITGELYSIVLSSDGKKATFDMYGGLDGTSGQWDIWIANADGSGSVTAVTNDSYEDSMPEFSPDGTKVLFTSYRLGDDEQDHNYLVTRNLDGTGEVVLPMPPGANDTWAPTYSPDGTKIAVEVWGRDTNQNPYEGIWVMNADGSNPQMLTNASVLADNCLCYFDHEPRFTPDGSKIAFSEYYETVDALAENIYTINPDGTGMTEITHTTGIINFNPAPFEIAGAGTVILFSSTQDNPQSLDNGAFELYSMKPDGSGITRLTNNTLYDAFCADWYYGSETSAARSRMARHLNRRAR